MSQGGPCVSPSLPVFACYHSQLQVASHNLWPPPKGLKGFLSHSCTEAGVLQASSCPGHNHLGAASSLPGSLGHRWLGNLEQSISTARLTSSQEVAQAELHVIDPKSQVDSASHGGFQQGKAKPRG